MSDANKRNDKHYERDHLAKFGDAYNFSHRELQRAGTWKDSHEEELVRNEDRENVVPLTFSILDLF